MPASNRKPLRNMYGQRFVPSDNIWSLFWICSLFVSMSMWNSLNQIENEHWKCWKCNRKRKRKTKMEASAQRKAQCLSRLAVICLFVSSVFSQNMLAYILYRWAYDVTTHFTTRTTLLAISDSFQRSPRHQRLPIQLHRPEVLVGGINKGGGREESWWLS